jgi:hypothetical protein
MWMWVKEWKRRKGCWSLATVSRNATDLAAKELINPIGGLLTWRREECEHG